MSVEMKLFPKDERRQHINLREYKGTPLDVMRSVLDYIENDSVTPMYEHMRPKIADIKYDGNELIIITSKNNYAGD